jgi:hypothetical protein
MTSRQNKWYLEKYCVPCSDHNLSNTTKVLHPEIIIKEICSFLMVPVGRVIGNKRDGNIAFARHWICDVLYSDTILRLSFKNIGRLLGGRDHSTVMHSVQRVSDLCETDPEYRERYRQIHIFLYDTDKHFRYTDKYFAMQKKNKVKKNAFHMV